MQIMLTTLITVVLVAAPGCVVLDAPPGGDDDRAAGVDGGTSAATAGDPASSPVQITGNGVARVGDPTGSVNATRPVASGAADAGDWAGPDSGIAPPGDAGNTNDPVDAGTADAGDTTDAGEPHVDPPTADTVAVPAGILRRGSDDGEGDERPVREIAVSAFRLDRTEVDVTAYQECVNAGACELPLASASDWCNLPGRRGLDQPMNCLTWDHAAQFCAWAGGRLPTEAEWEWAARGPEDKTYPWGETEPPCSQAVVQGCGEATEPVGRRPGGASWVGALDLAGNVAEWTADWYGWGYYAESSAQDPPGPADGSYRSYRGGGWSQAAFRMAERAARPPGYLANWLGFRCAYDVS